MSRSVINFLQTPEVANSCNDFHIAETQDVMALHNSNAMKSAEA